MISFTVTYRQSKCIEVVASGTSYKFYRIPYALLESKKHDVNPQSDFVVYLLSGKDEEHRDCLYVGTSTNGIDNRPTSHEDKKVSWDNCIVFTSFDPTFLNDSKIRYIEDCLKHAIDDTKRFVNKTKVTSGKAANEYEKEDCNKAIPYILEVYDMMGIDILPKRKVSLGDFVTDKSVGNQLHTDKATDYSMLKLNDGMKDWFKAAESVMKELDPQIIANVTSTYANFKYPGVSKTVAYFYPNKREGKVRVLLQGIPEWYNDPKVTSRPENMHNGDCKAMFFITCDADLKYFRLFAEIAVQRLGKR